ncbi:RES domain-containing protein [Luteolibacter sp. Populi]|uniref:RES domain-containing protein n=1 Tax=Luteolibacter sp. Populi TaxID=3230487 RepID=UPI00346747AD
MNGSISDDEEQLLCWKCVSDPFLKKRMQKEGRKSICDFCNSSNAKAVRLSLVADWIEEVFAKHFERTSPDPSDDEYWLLKNSESGYFWDRDGDPLVDVLSEVAGVGEEVADALVEILSARHFDFEAAKMGEESDFAKDSHYSTRAVDHYGNHHEAWSSFERTLHRESRYFSRNASEILNAVFEGIEDFVTFSGDRIVRDIGPGTDILTLFRARVFQSAGGLEQALKRPDLEIAPPPSERASAGRMNAQGISIFYGASQEATALAEVRPPVGSNVVVGEFELLRPVRILDIRNLGEIVVRKSYFDPDSRPLIERAAFLRELSSRIVQPAMPEREHRDYLVTQVIADYLASERGLDGLLFPSVQTGSGFNLALFHRASRTEPFDTPEGTTISVAPDGWDDDGPSPDFSVQVTIPKKAEEEPDEEDSWGFLPIRPIEFDFPDPNADYREPTLRLKPDNVKVHLVTGVQYESRPSSVRRTIFEGELDLSWMK